MHTVRTIFFIAYLIYVSHICISYIYTHAYIYMYVSFLFLFLSMACPLQILSDSSAENERTVCLINGICLPRDTGTPGHRDPRPEETQRLKSIINLRNPHPTRYPIGINMQINQIKLQNKIKLHASIICRYN